MRYATTLGAGLLTLALTGCAGVLTNNATAGQSGDDNTVTLYAVSGPEVTDPILGAFKSKHPGIKVNRIGLPGTGEAFARVRAEKDRPLGDVIWGGSSELYTANADLIAPVELPNDAATVAKDPDHIWHATDLLFQAIAVNTDKFPDAAGHPKTFADLAEPGYAGGKVGFATPKSSGTSYSLLTTMVTLHDWDYVDRFVKNARMLDGSTAMFNMVKDGEVGTSFINEDLGAKWIDAGAKIKLIYPEDGVSGQIGSAGVIKGAKHEAAAKTFVDFLMSKEAQQIMVDEVQRRSSRGDVPAPKGLPPVEQLKRADVDEKWAAEKKDEILAEFDDAVKSAG
ncbi:extracellular solute-binding protein [Nonomuraea longispora]|uniref:Extracellular solute-binding protein n=1 Tax=Nonomuraea longispora TaxID=1848320 RepID=A0A4V6P9Q0_9ACTN|nr:extracellular solute-binding protein [Nonomuraea longispora]TDC02006.1 extracellular solute-binding protein [Nonomuraea longispora]